MKKLLLLFGVILCIAYTHAAETYTTTSASATLSSNNTSWEENNVTWTLDYSWDNDTKTYFASETEGLHIGSASNFIKNVKMSTSGISGKIKSVTVTSRSNSPTSQLTVSVGNTQFKCADETSTGLTSTAKPYTFIGEGEGEIVINISNSTSGKNIYIKEVTVVYEAGDLGELSATFDGAPIENALTIYQGSNISFYADNATSIEVYLNNQTPQILQASKGYANWQPEICDNAAVSVIAKREVDGEEVQTSNTLTFNLTVKETLIADWIVTGIPSVAGGNAINNVALICSENSSPGVWKAQHDKSYALTTNDSAQLGSSNNTFNGGTLTLSDSDIPENAYILSISLTGYNNSTTPAVWSIKVGEKTSDNTITFSNTAKTNTANVNLIGNSIVLTCGGGTGIKQTYISGISIRYAIPEEEDKPGEVTIDYIPQYCLEANDDKTELTVMDGTELTFTSLGAAAMRITTEDEGVELPEATNGDKISWTVPAETIATIKVTASSESGKKTTERVYTIESEEIEPATPEYIFETDSKMVLITTDAGALMIMATPYTQTPEANATIMAIEPQEWAFTASEDSKSHEFSYDGMESTMNVSVKSTTPTKESNAVSFYVSNDGLVSGIENVAADNDSAEAAYYNLQGQRVEADRAGIYIRVQGGKAEKFIVH